MTPPPPGQIHGVSAWLTLLMIAALAVVLIGLLLLTEATMGVGLIAAGCFLGICARVLQAGAHHKAMMKRPESS